jgi:hypothetical protein
MAHFIRGLSGNWLVFFITLANASEFLSHHVRCNRKG